MERSHSYTNFTTATMSNERKINKNSFFQHSQTNINNINSSSTSSNNNNNDICYKDFKHKFASTSSLNLRKALELRQTQLQLQQQQQQLEQLEQLQQLQQRQQWQLLFEKRQQQQQQQHQFSQLRNAASTDNIETPSSLPPPLYLSTLNNLQLLQVRRQKMLRRQNSSISIDDELDYPHFNRNNDADDDDDEDDDGAVFEVTMRNKSVDVDVVDAIVQQNSFDKTLNSTSTSDELHDDQMSSISKQKQKHQQQTPQKVLNFQRQRPQSEAAINYRTPEEDIVDDIDGRKATPATKSLLNNENRRLQQYEQSISFDSGLSSTTQQTKHRTDSTMTATPTSTVSENMSPLSPRHPHFGKLKRDNSLHSDSSRYSSVDSLLESRKPDPEAILINLGFGPVGSEDILSRIPKRFLKPSQVRGIDTDAFIKRLQMANLLADHSVLGYRGLIGNPDLPPSTIVAKIMQRFEVNECKKSMGSIEQTMR